MRTKTIAGLVLSVIALSGLLAATTATAKPPKKPCTNCPQTITLPDGRVCTLETCGSDCVYVCPF